MHSFKHIGVTCNSRIQGIESNVMELLQFLKQEATEVYIDHRIRKRIGKKMQLKPLKQKKVLDLLIVLGGDGTMLRAVHENFERTKMFFGINFGKLGFLAEISPKELEKKLGSILCKKCNMDHRSLLNVSIYQKRKKVKEFVGLNEAVIHQTDLSRLANIKTEINNRKLATYYSDGLIIATPTGSTAYSLSAGGPIVHPLIPAFVITPINSHSFTQKPLVIPDQKSITIFPEIRNRHMQLTIDGQISYSLKPDEKIIIKRHKLDVTFLRFYEENYINTIRRKLGWGEISMERTKDKYQE